MLSRRLLPAVVALFVLSPCVAADFAEGKAGITISGPIQTGDARRLARFILEMPERKDKLLLLLELNSPGGSVEEALKIAQLVDRGLVQTWVPRGAVCASACFIIWAAGQERSGAPLGRLLVHRLSLGSTSTDIRATERALSPAGSAVEVLLSEWGIPRQVLDRMRDTPASDRFEISDRWLGENHISSAAMHYRPAFLEIAERNCGKSPETRVELGEVAPTVARFNSWHDCADEIRYANQAKEYEDFVSALQSLARK